MQIVDLRLIFFLLVSLSINSNLPLFYWKPHGSLENFGDELSKVIVEKIAQKRIINELRVGEKKLLALGSILHFATDGDVVWGAGINGKHLKKEEYRFKRLDVRSVRGPLTRKFLMEMGIECPKVYGDPALLLPTLFPEFKRIPINEYIIIPHISEIEFFRGLKNVVLPTEPWYVVVDKICKAKLVLSSSLHGIVVADAFGVSARHLKVTPNEPLFKYQDYYLGTGRKCFHSVSTVSEGLIAGGEDLIKVDLESLLESFPYDCVNSKLRKSQ